MELGFYKIYDDVSVPEFGTEQAACFDIRAYLFPLNESIVSYTIQNEKFNLPCCREDLDNKQYYIEISSHSRVLIPTGLIFMIPVGFSVRLHARSGLALKQGLVLANAEGVIDSDYILPTYVMMTNTSMNPVKIYHGDRIAQGELVQTPQYTIKEYKEKPTTNANRVGGFGSTGNT